MEDDPDADLDDDLDSAPASEVSRLEDLCLDVVAANVHLYEPASLTLPLGGGVHIVDRLLRSGPCRLRSETLGPLLNSDWSSSSEFHESLGSSLANAAPGCRGLAALAAQRLAFSRVSRPSAQGHGSGTSGLPDGTRGSTCSSAAALAAR